MFNDDEPEDLEVYEYCDECNGTGYNNYDDPCEYCEGTGQIHLTVDDYEPPTEEYDDAS